jgi:TP901 family phage tail tape measure protein
MANSTIEAVLRISSKMGDMKALKTLQREMRNIDNQAKAFNRTQTIMGRLQNNLATSNFGLMSRFIAPGVIGYAGLNAIKDFATVERQLTRTGLKVNATREEMKALRGTAGDVAREFALSSESVLSTVDAYAETGASLKDITSDMRTLAEAQQALGADGRDVVNTWDGARKSFGLMSKDAKRFFGSIGAGGSAGKFEASDMAQYFPSLLPVAAGFGMRGMEGIDQLVAFAEVQRDFVGTSGEAATAIGDFLEKVDSPTVQKAFSNFGIDLEKRMKAARDNGEDMLEFMHAIITEATKGDPTQLTKLFGDKEARRAARVVLEHMDKIRRAQDEIARNAPSVIDRNNKELLADAQAGIDKLSQAFDRLRESAGETLADAGAADAMNSTADNLDRARAINTALEKDGNSWWGRRAWWLRNGFDIQDQNLKAYEGGLKMPGEFPDLVYPTDAPQIGADVPRPVRRPARPGEAGYVAPVPTFMQPSGPENTWLGSSLQEQASAAAMPQLPQKLNEAISESGASASDAMKRGIEDGGAGVSDALRQAGDYIAAKILNAVSNIKINVGGAPGGRVNADVGRSGLEVELPYRNHGVSGGDIMGVP